MSKTDGSVVASKTVSTAETISDDGSREAPKSRYEKSPWLAQWQHVLPVVLAVAAIAWGGYERFLNKERSRIDFEVISSSRVTTVADEGLELRYDDQPISDASIIAINVANSGTVDLATEVLPDKTKREATFDVVLPEGARVLAARIPESVDPNYTVDMSVKSASENVATYSIQMFSTGHVARFTLTVENLAADAGISFRVAGVGLERRLKRPLPGSQKTLIDGLFFCMVLPCIVACLVVFDKKPAIQYRVLVVTISVAVAAAAIWLWDTLLDLASYT